MKSRIIFAFVLTILLMLMVVTPISAAKPANNDAGALTVQWKLSGAVMPVPPYGLSDIPGSDTASKLVVNQPNGSVEAAMTGVMNGLSPNTTYTVYLSNPWQPYAFTGWSVAGTWNFSNTSTMYPGGNPYNKTMTITQDSNGSISGSGNNVPLGWTWNVTGAVSGSTVTFTLAYNSPPFPNSGYVATLTGTIQADGSLIGTWSDNTGDLGNWYSTGGSATKVYSGTTSWPGLFTPTIQPFTFITDVSGSGSWHINMRDSDFPGSGVYALSVWINGPGGTVLISETFQVSTG